MFKENRVVGFRLGKAFNSLTSSVSSGVSSLWRRITGVRQETADKVKTVVMTAVVSSNPVRAKNEEPLGPSAEEISLSLLKSRFLGSRAFQGSPANTRELIAKAVKLRLSSLNKDANDAGAEKLLGFLTSASEDNVTLITAIEKIEELTEKSTDYTLEKLKNNRNKLDLMMNHIGRQDLGLVWRELFPGVSSSRGIGIEFKTQKDLATLILQKLEPHNVERALELVSKMRLLKPLPVLEVIEKGLTPQPVPSITAMVDPLPASTVIGRRITPQPVPSIRHEDDQNPTIPIRPLMWQAMAAKVETPRILRVAPPMTRTDELSAINMQQA